MRSGQCQSTVTHSPLKLSEHALGAACRARLPTQPSTASRGSATCARRTLCQSVCVCGNLWQSVRPPRTATLVTVDGDCPDTDRWLPGPTFKRHVYAFKRAYRRSSREQRLQRLNVQTIYAAVGTGPEVGETGFAYAADGAYERGATGPGMRGQRGPARCARAVAPGRAYHVQRARAPRARG